MLNIGPNIGANPQPKMIILELNELCPPLMDKFMGEGLLPHFEKLYARSEVFQTYATDEDLEPWVQWVTFHTGKPQAIHGTTQLDEGYRISEPHFWDRLAAKGVTSVIFGSMNSRPSATPAIFVLPDPWTVHFEPSDPSYEPFHSFIRKHVTEHTNPELHTSAAAVVDFAKFMVGHGLSLRSVMAAVSQLSLERLVDENLKWRRALILDKLMWDVFENTYRRRSPNLATFFANGTAYVQHRYWRHMDPDPYLVKPSNHDIALYGNAVSYAYQCMDKLVDRAMRLIGSEGALVFVTALSQEANLRYEEIGGKFVYRARNFNRLLEWCGAPAGVSIEPVMTHEAWATCACEEEAVACERAILGIESNGKTVMSAKRSGSRVFFCCNLIRKQADDFSIVSIQTGQSALFTDFFSLVGQVNNSQHNRSGCFWMMHPGAEHKVHDEKIPLEKAGQYVIDYYQEVRGSASASE